ncbi:MAG: citramalate synthase [Deltaproteobacteria bacterium]|nr:citramalate synthase [Deltaproteobacteria bacterium]MBI4373236.1 citramalate synthase [Deltaproteobacteria bacterium]
MRKVDLYDTTLRDGAQGEGISFSVEDKLRVSQKLDQLGISYIEGGWPGSNPKDDEFFSRKLKLRSAKLVAFGSTRRPGVKTSQDRVLKALLKAGTSVVTIFGKSWDLHVREALRASLDENLDMIHDSVSFLKGRVDQVFFDAEHFFDGFKANRSYALKAVQAARDAGADLIVLCDTNGGTLPSEVSEIIRTVRRTPRTPLGIHCHNDGELAVANSLAAVKEGVVQVHGTVNGFGERCGNANLISIAANLKLKMGIPSLSDLQLKRLRETSRFVDELMNRGHVAHQPFVGDSAFAHKGGIHASAIMKNRKTYEHIDPSSVGNRRRILISEQSGRSNIHYKARQFGLKLKEGETKQLLGDLKDLENRGFEFEGAEASFEILMKKVVKKHRRFFRLIGFRVIDEKRTVGEAPFAEATIQMEVDGKVEHTAANGVGPVNALDNALRKALERFYPKLKEVQLVDYKVRVLPGPAGTSSLVRVLIESQDKKEKWGTVGVSENIIEASWMALVDALEYKLMRGK